MPVICALVCKTCSTWLRKEREQHKMQRMLLFSPYLSICTVSQPLASTLREQLSWGWGRGGIFRGPGFAPVYGWPQVMSWNSCTTHLYTSPAHPANTDIKTALHCYHPYNRINISQRVFCCRFTVSPWSWIGLRFCLDGNSTVLLPYHLFSLRKVKAEVC